MADPTTLEFVLLGGAGLLAGAVNAVAGGGSLISFPALLAVGYPSVTANVTNNVALLPGYVGGTLAYRRELSGQGRRARRLGVTSAAGGLGGAVLLDVSPPGVFEAIVPFLILLSCALLVAQPAASRVVERRGHQGRPSAVHAGVFLSAVYGGYFGAGPRDHAAGRARRLPARRPAAAQRAQRAAVARHLRGRRRLLRPLRAGRVGGGGGHGRDQPGGRSDRGAARAAAQRGRRCAGWSSRSAPWSRWCCS